ncbi:MAG TPA: hypothetical protein VIH42_13325 [Thermoguttaceae bacterium]
MKTLEKLLAISMIFVAICSTATSSNEPNSTQPQKIDKKTPLINYPPFTISKETTYLVEPLREDGYVDYVGVLNKLCREGVTPENNAVVPLLQAVGPDVIFVSHREQFFHMLGIEPLPEQGDYLIPFEEYLKQINSAKGESATPEDPTKKDEQIDQFYKAVDGPWTEDQYPIVAAWLKANQIPLEKIREATQRPKFYDPMVLNGKVPLIALLRDTANQAYYCRWPLIEQAMFEIQQGKIEDAQENILACHRLARLVGQGPTEVEVIHSYAIEVTACLGDVALAQSGKLSPSDAAQFQEELRKLSPLPKMVDKINVAGRFEFLDCIASHAREEIELLKAESTKQKSLLERLFKPASSKPSDWDTVLRMGNFWYDRLVEAFHKPTYAERMEACKRLENEFYGISAKEKATAKSMLDGKNVRLAGKVKEKANIYIYIHHRGVGLSLNIEELAHVRTDLSHLALALGAYRSEHGSYPDRLDEVVPQYIAELPKDRFANADYIYRPDGKGYILYSIGYNGKDDGGKDQRDDPSCDDVVIRTPKETK